MKDKSGDIAPILGIPLFSNSKSDLLRDIESELELDKGRVRKRRMLIFTPNPEILLEAKRDTDFARVLSSADYNIPDGVGVLLASRVLSIKSGTKTISERITGTDMVVELASMANRKSWRMYLLGSKPGVASAAAASLKQAYPLLQVRANSGPVKLDLGNEAQNQKLIGDINAFKTDILFVAFGHGKQERWLRKYRNDLDIRLGMGIGGALDFYAGRFARAPMWMQRLGLEWLFRLTQEPTRLPRIIDATVRFPLEIIKSLF